MKQAIAAIRELQEARGSKEKQAVLQKHKDNEEFKRLLYYACHPRLTYKISGAVLATEMSKCWGDFKSESTFKSIFEVCESLAGRKAVDDATLRDVALFTEMATMGCRTMLGYDRHGLGYKKTGRGNVCPVTINLPKIGIKHGICLGERDKADLDGFWAELDEVLALTEAALLDRFYHICAQSVKSAPFMYQNGTIADYEMANVKGVYQSMRHGTLAFGYIGIAEMCRALFGKDHSEDEKVRQFAYSVVEHIWKYTKAASERNDLNCSCYATPAESLCKTYAKALRAEFGSIPNITDREYITNSHHVSVWRTISIYKKLEIEAPFCKFPTGGCITYVELDAAVMQNPKAIESIIDYAMSLNVPYLALNFPIDTCLKCGYSGEIEYNCPACGNTNIQRLRRVTGYLSADYRQFNEGKIAEVLDRVKHNRYTDYLGGETIEGEGSGD